MIHRHTPSLIVNDGRGLPIRQVAYLRAIAGAPVETLITRLRHDNAGRLVEQQDPRLSVPNFVNVFGLSEQPLKVDSVDAGPSLTLSGLAGEELQRWDARGNHWRTTYDDQLRAVRLDVNAMAGVEKMTYADATQDPGHNLCGQMIELEDSSGSVKLHSFAMTGPALRETRTFHDGKAFVSRRSYSPLGAELTQTDAGGHQRLSTYDVTGQLNRVQLQINGQTTWQTVLQDAQYSASGQIIEQQAGNGVTSHWHYRAADGRLHRHCAQKGSGPVLLDFEYEYDRMGNITRILDHAYTPTYFRNQRVEGHQTFDYDTLYRLMRATGYSDAPPSDNIGPPQPTDPADRRSYVEHYKYDHGDNLLKTTHVRDATSHTFEMFIDPVSNRGVRWKPGDPPPDFSQLFDRAGNLQALQPGVPMHWNARGELEKVTLIDRNGGRANDEEYYRYSQGQRVYKRHDTHTTKVSHFHEVRYLPGLEIRTKHNGEELHVITLDIGPGGARCLHWKKDPANIGADQLRFTLPDHLGSAVRELDTQARLITDERYLPFGGTAVYTRHSAVEVDYKTVRYSGKEMDVTRLYDYGSRYYADWLGRWVSADPAGTVDGLNLYAFVGNNPLRFIDLQGMNKEESAARQQITEYSNLLSATNSELRKLNYQLYNLTRTRDIYKTAGKKFLFSLASFAVAIKAGAIGGTIAGGAASVTGPAAPVAVPVAAAIGGIMAAEAASKVMEKLGDETTLGYTILPTPSALSVGQLKNKASAQPFSVTATARSFDPRTSAGLTKTGIETTARAVGKHLKVPYLKPSLAIFRQAAELTEALNDAWGQGDLDQLSARLDELSIHLDREEATALQNITALANADPAPVRLEGAMSLPQKTDNNLPALEQKMKIARAAIKQSRNLLGRVSAHIEQRQHAA